VGSGQIASTISAAERQFDLQLSLNATMMHVPQFTQMQTPQNEDNNGGATNHQQTDGSIFGALSLAAAAAAATAAATLY